MLKRAELQLRTLNIQDNLNKKKNEEIIQKVQQVINSNHGLTICEVAEDAGISKTTFHDILTENLGMHHVAAKFVLCLLSEDQKQNCVYVSKLVDCANADENFLKNIVTGDETWVYSCTVETKDRSSQWISKMSPRPKTVQQVWSNVNIMLTVFFYCKDIIHHEFLPCGQTVNKEYYLNVMKRLREAVR